MQSTRPRISTVLSFGGHQEQCLKLLTTINETLYELLLWLVLISRHKTTVFILGLIIILLPNNSLPANKSSQRTEGDQSPIVNVGPGGKSTINYGAPVTVPLPPIFTVQTEKDLKLYIDSNYQISADHEASDRLNILEIYNQCKIPIYNLEVFTQFPEAIAEIHSDSESGCDYKAHPVWDDWSVHVGAENQAPKLSSHQPKTGLWKIVIPTLPALTRFKIDFVTTVGKEADAYVGGMQWPLEISKKEGLFCWMFYGTYQFQQGQAMGTSRFSVPLKYDLQKRLIETQPLIVDGFKDGAWLKFMFMPAVILGNVEYGGSMVFFRGTSKDFRSSVRPGSQLLKKE